MNKKDLINKYINFRLNNQVENILNMFSNDGYLISLDDITYKGKDNLKNYYNIPQSISPSVGNVFFSNGKYYVDLSFLGGIKVVRSYFEFNDNNLITKITLESIGWI